MANQMAKQSQAPHHLAAVNVILVLARCYGCDNVVECLNQAPEIDGLHGLLVSS